MHEVRSYLAGRVPTPAIALLQAPVFHSYTFTVCAGFKAAPAIEDIVARLELAGLKVAGATDEPPNNVNVAGEGRPVLGQPRDIVRHRKRLCLVVGATDTVRVPVTTAVAIAEKLLAS